VCVCVCFIPSEKQRNLTIYFGVVKSNRSCIEGFAGKNA
jgi:hypothetical protein